ncbi:bifunctional folylpolyglutamate synthase/dihydrofolate synthase [Candidatus Micrarchaeota archaeon]|nr:bifunctional folylpolyglutamate synthase/dihydrofolate synthase [Candidatus Micrarchaeota archaeon]
MKELEKELAKRGVQLGLDRTKKLMQYWDKPHQKYKIILVAGTNGKGSVTSYISSILKEAGYKVGSYYSPHVVRYNERFRINGKMISNKEFKKYEKEVLKYAKKNQLTFFEALTGIAFKYFADKDVDWAVVEVGLGGRLDATNIADAAISVITNVELEHTDVLGKTIGEITFEKAGILKKGIGITGATGKALVVIKENAGKRGVRLKVLNEDFFAKDIKADSKSTKFNYIGEDFYTGLETALIGRYQASNAALAVAAVEQIGVEGEAIRKGLKKAENLGRLQLIRRKPLVIADAAHNVHGIKGLIENLSLFDYENLILVFGVMEDKNWREMIELIAPHSKLMIVNQPKIERAADPKEIEKVASKLVKTKLIKDVRKSVKEAIKLAKKKDLILVCGSIYMLGEVFEVLKK